MQIEELIGKYVQIRDGKRELEEVHKAKVAKINHVMKKIEGMLLEHFNSTGAESVRTPAGTAYRSVKTTAKVVDRDAYMQFVQENEAWSFLESRANSTAVEEYLAAHGSLPPGVDVSRYATIGIRRG
jgi:hypothetical protein